jgi:quercetin dioxygenase-like cupin family protein
MKRIPIAILASSVLLAAGCSHGPEAQPTKEAAGAGGTLNRDQDRGPSTPIVHTPDAIEWKQGPESFEAGARFAVLEGDPASPGFFTMRFRFPDGFVIRPHWHPNVERITVLQGVFHLGMGDTLDEGKVVELPTGTYGAMPKKMVHWARSEGETIVQLTSLGPWEIVYVRPEDDPRKR